MIDVKKYDFFIFDCDGVILDSNRLKSIAFQKALSGEPPELVVKFVEYHKKNGGISRYEKFRYYFETMATADDSKKEIKNALNNFASIVSEGLMNCDYIPGAINFIHNLFVNNKSLFIVSGSDEKELNEVFKKRNILYFFKNIYGSPIGKIENTNKVIKSINQSEKGIFFGDSYSDYDAAKKYKLDFIFVNGASEWKGGEKLIPNSSIIRNFKYFN
ncbi:HAD hydrolase-like protein [Caldithrix abyssi]|nr:HAD hydrolase-like protein [Caldithrix abyssi]